MSAQSIKQAALLLFAEHGYEGTSLSQIAEETGMKKQSLYSHFKSKDDLFLQVLRETFSAEFSAKETILTEQFDEPLSSFLLKTLRAYVDRYEQEPGLKFWLRMSFFPPAHLLDEVMTDLYQYIDQVDALYLSRFQKAAAAGEMKRQDPETATLAFSALVDSVCVELVYGGTERAEQKLNAAWKVFWAGIL